MKKRTYFQLLLSTTIILPIFLAGNVQVNAENLIHNQNSVENNKNEDSTMYSTSSSENKMETSEKEEVKESESSRESVPFNVDESTNLITPFVFEQGDEQLLDNGLDITVVDDEGRYIKGPRLEKQDSILKLKYMGSDIVKDTKKWFYSDSSGKWKTENRTVGYDPETDSATFNSGPDVKYEIKNFGIYNGKKIILWFQDGSPVANSTSIPKIANFTKFPWKIYNDRAIKASIKIWVEYEDGSRLENTKILFPYQSLFKTGYSRFKIVDFKSRNIENIIALDSSIPKNSREALYSPKQLPNVFQIKQDTNTNLIFNLVVDGKNDIEISSNQHEKLSGNPVWGTQWGNEDGSINIFDTNVPILLPLYYPKPIVYKQISKSSSTALGNFKVTQDLVKQNPNNYPDETTPLVIRAKISDIAGVKTPITNIKIVTTEGIDVTDQIHVQDMENGTIEFSVWGEAIKNITGEGTTLTITGEFQPDTKSKEFLSSLNSEDNYFHIPIEASNSDKGFENIDSNEALIEMPKPAATPIPQTVAINTSTKDLKPEELVKDLSSIFPGDSVDVVGFKAEKIFDSVGVNEVIVVIKSVQTGIINEITVPVDVVANLKFKSVPETMAFLPITINSGSKLIERENSDWKIEIDNSIGAEWRVYAKATPVKDTTDQIYTNALLFKDESGVNHQLTSEQTLIAEGNNSDKEPIIKWNKDQGVLFNFDPGVMKEGKYEFVIEWNLETAP